MSETSSDPKFFGRRKGRPLSAARQNLIETLLPRLSVPLDGPPNSLDPATLFPNHPKAIWLEVGFGGGEHLIDLARGNPDIGFIGCEPYMNGVAKALRGIEENNLTNIRLVPDDARLLFRCLMSSSLDRLYVLFPDPWPKRRHWERRFIGPANLPEFKRLLTPNAELRAATDHPSYLEWMLFHLRGDESFAWRARRADDWRVRPDDWPETRYERKSLAGKPTYMIFDFEPGGE